MSQVVTFALLDLPEACVGRAGGADVAAPQRTFPKDNMLGTQPVLGEDLRQSRELVEAGLIVVFGAA